MKIISYNLLYEKHTSQANQEVHSGRSNPRRLKDRKTKGRVHANSWSGDEAFWVRSKIRY